MGGWGGCEAGSAPHVWGGVGVLCCAPGGCAVGLVGSEQRGPSVGAPRTALRRCGAAGGGPQHHHHQHDGRADPPLTPWCAQCCLQPHTPVGPPTFGCSPMCSHGVSAPTAPLPETLLCHPPSRTPPRIWGLRHCPPLSPADLCSAGRAPPAPRDPRHVPAALARPPHRPGSRRWGSQWGPLSPAGLWGGGGGTAAGWGGATPTPVGPRGPIPPFLRPYVLGAPRLCWWGASPQEGFPPTHHP